jgi:hypothetical protein
MISGYCLYKYAGVLYVIYNGKYFAIACRYVSLQTVMEDLMDREGEPEGPPVILSFLTSDDEQVEFMINHNLVTFTAGE